MTVSQADLAHDVAAVKAQLKDVTFDNAYLVAQFSALTTDKVKEFSSVLKNMADVKVTGEADTADAVVKVVSFRKNLIGATKSARVTLTKDSAKALAMTILVNGKTVEVTGIQASMEGQKDVLDFTVGDVTAKATFDPATGSLTVVSGGKTVISFADTDAAYVVDVDKAFAESIAGQFGVTIGDRMPGVGGSGVVTPPTPPAGETKTYAFGNEPIRTVEFSQTPTGEALPIGSTGFKVETQGANYSNAIVINAANKTNDLKDQYYPYGDGLKDPEAGVYLFLGAGGNDDSTKVILTLPEKVTSGQTIKVTYARPKVTNNGNRDRTVNDPGIMPIGDAEIVIGTEASEVDTWTTAEVKVTADVSEITFALKAWGAVAIAKIEVVSEGSTGSETTPSESTDTETTKPTESTGTETTQSTESAGTETTKPTESTGTETTEPTESTGTETTKPTESTGTETTQSTESTGSETTKPTESTDSETTSSEDTGSETTPSESQEPEPSETEEPLEPGVYLNETFDKYEVGQIIASANSETKPADVAKGNLIYAAGNRSGGGMTSAASVVEGTDSNCLHIVACGYAGGIAGQERGVSFTFKEGVVPALDTLDAGKVLELSMDVKATGDFALTGFGTISIGDVAKNDFVHLQAIIDPTNKVQHTIATKGEKVLHYTSSVMADNATFSGATFYTPSMTADIDNLKVAQAEAPDITNLNINVKDAEGADLKGAKVVIEGFIDTVTDDNGAVSTTLPYDTYTITASLDGYQYDENTAEASTEVTLNTDEKSVELILTKITGTPTNVVVNFKDTDGKVIKEAVTLTQLGDVEFFEGQPFALPDSYKATIQVVKTEGGSLKDVYQYKEGTNLTIASMGATGTNEVNLTFEYFGTYDDFEDFNVGDDIWGFVPGYEGNTFVEDGVLRLKVLNQPKDDIKTFDSEISEAKKVEISFDWCTDIETNKGRESNFDLCDSDGNIIFSLYGHGQTSGGTSYAINQKAAKGVNKFATESRNWLRVNLTIEFLSEAAEDGTTGTISGTIVDIASGNKLVTIAEGTKLTAAKNLGSMGAYFNYSQAPQKLDNVGIKYTFDTVTTE